MENKSVNIICYLSNGAPSIEKTFANAERYIAGGCDIIEVDIPSDDPYLDNELIQTRMKSSFAQDESLLTHLQTIVELKNKHPQMRLIILSYESSILRVGLDRFAETVRKVNAEGVILVGEKDQKVRNSLQVMGIKCAAYVPFDLPEEDIENAKRSNSFIYLQAKPSGKIKAGLDSLDKVIRYLRETIGLTNPIYCGVGVSTPDDICMLKESGADGAFIGSGVIKRENDPDEQITYIHSLKLASR